MHNFHKGIQANIRYNWMSNAEPSLWQIAHAKPAIGVAVKMLHSEDALYKNVFDKFIEHFDSKEHDELRSVTWNAWHSVHPRPNHTGDTFCSLLALTGSHHTAKGRMPDLNRAQRDLCTQITVLSQEYNNGTRKIKSSKIRGIFHFQTDFCSFLR